MNKDYERNNSSYILSSNMNTCSNSILYINSKLTKGMMMMMLLIFQFHQFNSFASAFTIGNGNGNGNGNGLSKRNRIRRVNDININTRSINTHLHDDGNIVTNTCSCSRQLQMMHRHHRQSTSLQLGTITDSITNSSIITSTCTDINNNNTGTDDETDDETDINNNEDEATKSKKKKKTTIECRIAAIADGKIPPLVAMPNMKMISSTTSNFNLDNKNKNALEQSIAIADDTDANTNTDADASHAALKEDPITNTNVDRYIIADKIDSIYNVINNQYLQKMYQLELLQSHNHQHNHHKPQSISQSSSQSISSLQSSTLSQQNTFSSQIQQHHNATTLHLLRTSLENSGFQLLSQRDLDLCKALNGGYLLRLSIAPDLRDLDDLYWDFYNNVNPVGDAGGYSDTNDDGNNVNDDIDTSITADNLQELLFEGKILIFRRGYSQEITSGRLLLPKLDYLQSSLVQRSAYIISQKLTRVEEGIQNDVAAAYQRIVSVLFENSSFWKDQIPNVSFDDIDMNMNFTIEEGMNISVNVNVKEPLGKGVNTMLKNVSIAIATGATLNNTKSNIKLERYGYAGGEGKFVDSPDDTDALSPFLVCEIENEDDSRTGIGSEIQNINGGPNINGTGNDGYGQEDRSVNDGQGGSQDRDGNVEQDLWREIESRSLSCKYDTRKSSTAGGGTTTSANTRARARGRTKARTGIGPNRSIEPPIHLLNRVSIANLVDFFSQGGRRRLIKSLFSISELVEPTYEEVVLVYRPKQTKQATKKRKPVWTPPKFIYDIFEIFAIEDILPKPPTPEPDPSPLPLEIRTFDRVPMANLLAVLPKTKLIFRPADALIFDLVNTFSLLAVLASQKFDSPKLDLIAFGAVSLWLLRTFFRYSNKIARYDLLVNKFLTGRISHRNSGAVKYLASEAAVQRARRAALVHEWLVEEDNAVHVQGGTCHRRDEIVRVGLSKVNARLDLIQPLFLDVDAALDDLLELGLIGFNDEGWLVNVKSGDDALESLANLWNDIF